MTPKRELQTLNRKEFEALMFATWKAGYSQCMMDKYPGSHNWVPQFKAFLVDLLENNLLSSQEICPQCHGEGTVPGKTGGSEGIPEADVMFVCNECGGTGKIKKL